MIQEYSAVPQQSVAATPECQSGQFDAHRQREVPRARPAGWVFVAVLLLWAVPWATAEDTPKRTEIVITQDIELPAQVRWAWDVRWSGEHSVYVVACKFGTYEIDLKNPQAKPTTIIPGLRDGGYWFARYLALSDDYLVVSAPVYDLIWKGRTNEGLTGMYAMSEILDIDSSGNQLLVLGVKRDESYQYAPDGAIAWLGSLEKNLEDLQPLLYSADGPGASSMVTCGYFGQGKVRSLPDGTLVVVPGVEPGVYLYDSGGKLKGVIQTENLGFDTDCPLTVEEAGELKGKFELSSAWINRRRLLDEILPLGNRIGLVIRTVKNGRTTWVMKVVQLGGDAETVDMPLTSSSIYAGLRGDVRGSHFVLLVREGGELEDPPPAPPRLVVGEVRLR